MEKIKLKPVEYFYCIISKEGYVQIWDSSYYRKQTISFFIRRMNGHINNWEEAKKLGYVCKKFKVELIK